MIEPQDDIKFADLDLRVRIGLTIAGVLVISLIAALIKCFI